MAAGKLNVGELFRLITGHEPYDYQLRAWERIGSAMSSGRDRSAYCRWKDRGRRNALPC